MSLTYVASNSEVRGLDYAKVTPTLTRYLTYIASCPEVRGSGRISRFRPCCTRAKRRRRIARLARVQQAGVRRVGKRFDLSVAATTAGPPYGRNRDIRPEPRKLGRASTHQAVIGAEASSSLESVESTRQAALDAGASPSQPSRHCMHGPSVNKLGPSMFLRPTSFTPLFTAREREYRVHIHLGGSR